LSRRPFAQEPQLRTGLMRWVSGRAVLLTPGDTLRAVTMRIGIISDILDHLWNLKSALEKLHKTDLLICCGDLCSPFVIDELAQFHAEVHIIFGNNDADLYRITTKSASKPNVKLHGEFLSLNLDGVRIAANHFDYIARPIARSGDFDLVCFGHNHEFELSQSGSCQLINPGPILGAKFSSGKWQDVAPTFVFYDTATKTPSAFAVDPSKAVGPYRW
jgi:uncharacterized protein